MGFQVEVVICHKVPEWCGCARVLFGHRIGWFVTSGNPSMSRKFSVCIHFSQCVDIYMQVSFVPVTILRDNVKYCLTVYVGVQRDVSREYLLEEVADGKRLMESAH